MNHDRPDDKKSEIMFDRRHAAFHEAGHAVMMVILDTPVALVEIWKNHGDAVDALEENPVLGRVLAGPIEVVARKAIGLAGLLAEEIDQEGEVYAEDWIDCIELGVIELSGTDAELVGGPPELGDVERTLELLRENWPAVVAVADRLMNDGFLTSENLCEIMAATTANSDSTAVNHRKDGSGKGE